MPIARKRRRHCTVQSALENAREGSRQGSSNPEARAKAREAKAKLAAGAAKAEAEAKAKVEAAKAEAEAKAKVQVQAQAEADADSDAETEAETEKAPAEEAETAKVGANVALSDSSGSSQFTPKTEDSSLELSNKAKQDVPPVDSPPPPEPEPTPIPALAPAQYVSDNDSSDSPVSDYEDLYSSDDMTRTPNIIRQPRPHQDGYDTEEEEMPAPWSAVCIVGIRVYSKDEDLELYVIDGSGLLEDGMGEKGQADLDNFQSNAAPVTPGNGMRRT